MPAPDSMATVKPARVNFEIMSGTRATRFSPDFNSLGTNTRIGVRLVLKANNFTFNKVK